MEPSEIKKNIEGAIREGVDREYLDIVKDLKDTYYLEDIAAAAIALCARQGGQQGVRRRTLHDVSFVPLMTREAKGAGEVKKPTQHPAKPVAVRKSLHGSQRSQGGPSPQGGQRSQGGERPRGGQRLQGGQRSQDSQRPQGSQRPKGGQMGPRGPASTGAPERSGPKRRR